MKLPQGRMWTQYRVPLSAPPTVPGAPDDAGGEPERRGLLVCLDGALGEVAPLPGLHDETLEQIAAALAGWEIPLDMDGDARALLWQLNNAPGFAPLPPSLRFGIESAVVLRGADRAGVDPAAFLWPDDPTFDVPSVGLFAGSAGQAQALLEQGAFAGYAGVKIKIGRAPLAEDLRTIGTFRELWPGAELRLDANRALDRAAVDELAAGIAGLDVALVEEPFADPEELQAYLEEHAETGAGLPLALDESLVAAVRQGRRPAGDPPVAGWVLKPSCLGLLPALWLIESSFDTAAIVSSSFETGVGLRMLRALAAGSDVAPGLGTDRWFPEALADRHLSGWRPLGGGAA